MQLQAKASTPSEQGAPWRQGWLAHSLMSAAQFCPRRPVSGSNGVTIARQ
jgi:hypothetical protein